MNSADMDALISRHIAAEAAQDLDAAVAVYTEDVVHDVVGSPSGPTTGVADARGFYEHFMQDVRTERMELSRAHHGDDFCVTEHLWTGTVPGALMGVPGHGRRISMRVLHVFEFANGKISRENAWLDAPSAFAQLAAPNQQGAAVPG
jgi:steroid delta-isomerase-like uncharacterized protein